MYISIFSDEFFEDVYTALPKIAAWGMEYVDFRGMIGGKPIEKLSVDELKKLRSTLDSLGLKTGVIQSSLCKVHLPDEARCKAEEEKLEGIIRASDILGTRLVRSFNYWQHKQDDPRCGELAMRPDALAEVLDMYSPIAKRAKEAGLILGFENCGQTPNEAIAFLNALNVPEWGLAWDVSNMFELLPEAKGDCVDYFCKALKYANMIHVKARGVSAVPEIDAKKVPWERVLAGAYATGKNLPISIETHVVPGCGLTGEQASKRCYDYLKKVFPSAAAPDVRTAVTLAATGFIRPYADDPVRFVVVGLGMGKNRCRQIVDTNGCRLIGVCDINESKAKAVGEQFGVEWKTNIEDWLTDPRVEVMYIVTPTGTHCELAKKCLNAGKNVLLTKPMDVTYQACDEAIKLAKEKGLLLGVDFDLHFRGSLSELQNAVKGGFFGNILSADIILDIKRDRAYFEENGGWRGTWALDGGGALSNQGIHEIDRLISVLGMPSEVRAIIRRRVHDIEAEDIGYSEWKYPDGKVARVFVTTDHPKQLWYTRLEIIGDWGAYLLTAGGPEGTHTWWTTGGEWTEEPPFPYTREWAQGSDNFAYSLRTGAPLVCPAEEGRDARYVLDMMYESAKNGEGFVKI